MTKKYRVILERRLDMSSNDMYELFVEVNGQVYREGLAIPEREKEYHLVRNTEEYVVGTLLERVGRVLKDRNKIGV